MKTFFVTYTYNRKSIGLFDTKTECTTSSFTNDNMNTVIGIKQFISNMSVTLDATDISILLIRELGSR